MKNRQVKKVKILIGIYIVSLLLSGITAFPLEQELTFLKNNISENNPAFEWITIVFDGVTQTNAKYPFMAYGTDWLAFAHIAISIFFIGAIKDPVQNIWVIDSGIIISILIFPLAFIAGSVRGIPFYWQLIDCSFGIFSIAMLWPCRKLIMQIQNNYAD